MRPERPTAGLVIATGHFQERALAYSLSSHFRRSWIYQLTGPDASAAATVLPDGLIHLRWCEGKLSVAGLGSSARVEILDANSPVVGSRFSQGPQRAGLVRRRLKLQDAASRLKIYGVSGHVFWRSGLVRRAVRLKALVKFSSSWGAG